MCIKFYKGNENLRFPVLIKNHFFKIWSGFLHFLSLSRLRDVNFFSSNVANGISKNLPFHTDFKNVSLASVKSASKKVLDKKMFFQLYLFLGKNFFWVHFY
jgi:hypothetical protein